MMGQKKNVLLVTSAAPCQSPFSTSEKRPPIGIGFLISVLRDAGHNVFFIDNYLNPSNFLETDYIQRNDIDVVGIYANTICYRDTLRMLYRLDALRRAGKWNGQLVVGGPHATVALDTIPAFVDHVVQGEGERAILDIVHRQAAERVLRYRCIRYLDELPMPAWDYFVHLPYSWGVEWFDEKPVFTMNTSRGCPFQCAFCSVGSIWGKKYSYFSAERIVRDIEFLVQNYGAKGIYFREDNFTLNRKRLTAFCNMLIEKQLKVYWACESRVNTLDEDLVDLMRRAGLRAFYFGVESGSQRVLDFLKKGITIEQTRKAFALCHRYGIKAAASIIVGVPTETEDELLQTEALVRDINPAVTWHNVFVGIPNSELYRYTIDKKLYEFIDDRGLVYLKGHDDRVKRFYGNAWDALIPFKQANPKISVVMSVYNGADHLEEAVKSILKQTYPNFEFIIIDDASMDATPELLSQFEDPRIQIYRNNENIGLTRSLNLGIEKARGEYIARMDADDLSHPFRFEKQVAYLDTHQQCLVVGTWTGVIQEDGQQYGVWRTHANAGGLLENNAIVHGSAMIRKTGLQEVGGYDANFRYAQDYELWFRMSEIGELANLQEELYYWRNRKQSISNVKKVEQDQFAAHARSMVRERRKQIERKFFLPGKLGNICQETTDNNSVVCHYHDAARTKNNENNYNKNMEKVGLVSIIIPTFNCDKWICDAIDSSLNQSYKNCEIIVVDDGSIDGTGNIINLKYNGKIKYLYQSNMGLPSARNRGIDEAKGEYIQFLDADDILVQDKIKLQIEILKNMPKYSVSYSDYQSINISDGSCNASRYLTPKTNTEFFFRNIIKDWETRLSIPIHCFLFKSAIFNDYAIRFDASLPNHEDWDCWVRIFYHNPQVKYIDNKLAIYRIKELSMCSNRELMRFGYMQSIDKYINEFRGNNEILKLLFEKKQEVERCYRNIRVKAIKADSNSTIINTDTHKLRIDRALKAKKQPRLIAFYLPQYHPIPENDMWWGKGFTEWTNVTKAKPLFEGHYQPHLPKDLGFYDLRLPEVREEQVRLAKEYGIYGFCYYHYWFNGKRLLNRPFDEILSTKKPNFPFCLCWANEHWTRAWDGHQGEILMHQEFSEEDDRNHMQWLLKVFQDKRYIRINEKPLMIVYLSTRLPNASRTAEIWREEAEKAEEELYLCKVESAPYEYGDPRLIGFDACIEFQPDWGNLGPCEKRIENDHVVFNYEAVANRMLNKEIAKYKRYPCVTPMWDNSPRRQRHAVIFDNSSPAVYGKWLGSIANNIAKYNLDDSIVFINAWNEWGEGNHLEPDLKHENKYLEATKQALLGAYSSDTRLDKGLVSIVVLTCNEIRYTKECIDSVQKYTQEPHEIIFVDNGSTDGTVKWLRKLIKHHSSYRLVENKNNLGFSKGCNQGIEAATGEFILLLNNDVVVTENWLGGMLECLHYGPGIGIVGPMTNNISGPQKVPSVNYIAIDELDEYSRAFRKKNRHRRIPNRRVVGFCMLFSRQLIEEIGFLDETFGSGNFEDDDLCLRASLAGYRNMIAGDVFLHHYGSRTFIGNGIDYGSSLSGNRRIFIEKWNGEDVARGFGGKLIVENAVAQAEELFRKGDIEKATACILGALKEAPHNRGIYFKIAEMLIDVKRYQDAVDILGALQKSDSDPMQAVLLGYCEEALGNNEKAQEYAERALAIDARASLPMNVLGVLAFKKGEHGAAEDLFRKAIELDPAFGESYTNLGSLKWAAGKTEEAMQLFEQGFILSPTVSDVATAYHTAVVEMKSFEKAEAVVREARSLHPNHKRIAFLLIALLLQQEKHDSAMHEIERAMIQFGIDDGILSAGLEIRKRIGALEIDKSKRGRATLSLCMIVKNEESHLAKCLMSVKPVVDEMILVDTGSSDRTKSIAAALGARVFDYPWTNDYSEARNYSLSKATGDWVLVLDADEVISPSDHPNLLKLTGQRPRKPVAYILTTRNYTNQAGSRGWLANEGQYSGEEAGQGWVPSPKVRLFVNHQQIRFVNPVHELVEPTLEKLGIKVKACDVPVHHYGRLDQNKLLKKGKEYFRLGIAKIEQTNGDCKALKELAIQASEIGEYDEAVRIWKQVVALQPNDAVAHMNMGFAHLMMRQYPETISASRKAMELDPHLREAVINYSAAEMIAGDIQTAISTLEALLKKNPNYPPAKGRLAAAYLVAGRKAEGLHCLDALKARGFDCAGALTEQAQSFIAENKVESAALLLESAIESGTANGRSTAMLAECRTRLADGARFSTLVAFQDHGMGPTTESSTLAGTV